MNLSDEMKKIFLVGIGAIATSAEKTKEMIDTLIEKGELTLEQGKIINEELRRNLTNHEPEKNDKNMETLLKKLDTLSKEELSALREKLNELEKKDEIQRHFD
ncbi:aspartyl beta-hydroxylase [Dehalobacter sp. DCM]|uniref:phasin family protein n=1 Tax=Dehalobacter sp. DCM TaxID=2907827 RepID=UPI003081AB95|nr:aspartyl beta-hydroxylase [Dehalobacter sp. DCM]